MSTLGAILWYVQERSSYPIVTEQVIRSEEDEAATQAKKQAKQRHDRGQPQGRPGRQVGSKNRDKTQIEWTTELRVLDRLLRRLLELILQVLAVTYVVLDGQFGNNNALVWAAPTILFPAGAHYTGRMTAKILSPDVMRRPYASSV